MVKELNQAVEAFHGAMKQASEEKLAKEHAERQLNIEKAMRNTLQKYLEKEQSDNPDSPQDYTASNKWISNHSKDVKK